MTPKATATTIAAVGPIAFVALFAPHIARGVLASSDARQVLIVSALSGAGLTVAMVLHDLNHAAAFSDYIVVLHHGAIVAAGAPWAILTPDLLHDVFGVVASVISDPLSGTPLIAAHRSAAHQ